MFSTRNSVQVLKSRFVVGHDLPILGASPDTKVIDTGYRDPFDPLAKVKCPESKFRVTPAEARSGPNFNLELVNGRVTSLIILFPQLPLNFVLNQLT